MTRFTAAVPPPPPAPCWSRFFDMSQFSPIYHFDAFRFPRLYKLLRSATHTDIGLPTAFIIFRLIHISSPLLSRAFLGPIKMAFRYTYYNADALRISRLYL